ncbi:MAG: hypothetical protein R2752_20695 [Vicinamibacterales bacterium]
MSLRDHLPVASAPADCAREDEVLDLVVMGQWPARADADLRGHAATCAICRDVVAAAGAIVTLEEAQPVPALPDASVVWARAERRAREEAARRAAQPLHLAIGVAAASVAGLAFAWWRLGAPWLAAGWHRLTAAVESSAPRIPDVHTVTTTILPAVQPLTAALLISLLVVSIGVLVARMADR